ncbi:enediyne antibiotic chromoprotein [Streptomyces sp. NBC_01408]|uniref:enediyne antibiotic chromoprotein n=1 Tax=Streptomyces sp. NBC_01408 TaxID=2903855 RepID=UPI00224C8626|nr:enediyne antibiotic chromoprotein [Streptomyces sp. NBC_01408]MCX4696913.1 enediyne antibiotic chromoprotein [Streptomyces sp. NBC_01408]
MQITRTRLSQFAVLGATAAAAIALAAGPASAAATVSVSPSTGLSDGQSVTVTGAGYAAGSEVGVAQCADGIVCATAVVANADANGGFQQDYQVHKTFQATDWATGAAISVDCAVTQCRVVAWQETTGQVGSNISFN